MRASYPDKSQTEGTTGLTTHKHYGAAVQTDRAECRHSQVMVPRQTTGPNHTNFACNSIGRRFNKASKRCNSNTAKPWFEIVEGELHAKLVKKTEKARGHGAWPGFEPTRRAKLAARPASGPDGARSQQEHRWRSQQEHRWRSQQEQRRSARDLVDERLGPGTSVRYRAHSHTSCQSSDTGVTP